MAKSTTQIDSVVTYEYNDDFEKVEALTASKKQVPEINIQLSGNPSKLYNYLESTSIINNGKLNTNYIESDAADYMKSDNILIDVDFSHGSKNFTAYTMDLTKKYIEINSDYRS